MRPYVGLDHRFCRGVIHHARSHPEEGRNELRPYVGYTANQGGHAGPPLRRTRHPRVTDGLRLSVARNGKVWHDEELDKSAPSD